MGLTLKKCATILVFMALGAASQANATNYGTLAIDGTPRVAVTGASFDDIFNFTLEAISDIAAVGQSIPLTLNFPPPFGNVVLPPVTFNNASLFDSNNQPMGPVTVSGSNFSFSGSSLAAGSYTLHIAGNAGSSWGGAYAVSLQALPVPEPGEWVLMLTGLALVGTIARRRVLHG